LYVPQNQKRPGITPGLDHFLMDQLNTFLEFLRNVFLVTFSQLVWLLGILFIFGLLLYALARFTRITYVKTAGRNLDIFLTGWIGTPVHELGHAIFCILFRHRILEMRLFAPNSADGTIGYVYHSYNTKSVYQRIGKFFIGVGPITFGAVVIYALLYFLVPNREEIFNNLHQQSQVIINNGAIGFLSTLSSMWDTVKITLQSLFVTENFASYKFWIFLYVAVCVASHMELSPPDIKGAAGGLITMVAFFLFLNFTILGLEALGFSKMFGSLWHLLKVENYSVFINQWLGIFSALFVLAVIISALNFLVSYSILLILNLIRGRGFVNPFWM